MTTIHLAKDKHVVGLCKHGNKASGLSNYICWMYYHLNRPTHDNLSPLDDVCSRYLSPWARGNGVLYSVVRDMPTHTVHTRW